MRLNWKLLAFFGSALAVGAPAQIGPGPSGTSALDRLHDTYPELRVSRLGARVSRLYGPPFGYGFTPEQSASSFVEQYGTVFDPGMGKLSFAGSQQLMDGKFTAVYFNETVMGLPVIGGDLTLLVKNTVGSPIVLAVSSVQPVQLRVTLGQISAEQAKAIVRRQDPSLFAEDAPVMVAYPSETDTKLAWTFRIANGDLAHQRRFTVFVDASTGQVLGRRNEVLYTDVNGHVDAWATPGLAPNQPNNPAQLMNLADVTARIVSGNSTRTNASGSFTITNGGTAAVTVQSELIGSWVNVNNNAGADELLSLGVTPPGPANFTFNTLKTEPVQAQVDGFINVQTVHNYAKSINSAYPGIDLAIPCNVNLANTCNAFYSNNTVNFYASGGGCPNTSYSTVVWHEYGHFIIAHGNPNPTGDYHEGMADVNASMLANSSCLGLDFFGQGTGCLRSTYNSVNYPCSGEVHLCGQVISGAFWLTKDQLDITIGAGPALTLSRQLYLNSILLHPVGITPQITIDVLTLDDNDGNILNGTPHYTEIATGFGAKNLDAPDLTWLTITPVTVPGEFWRLPSSIAAVPVAVDVQNVVGTLDPLSVRLVYRVNGGAWQERPMLNSNPNTVFRSTLPLSVPGTIMEWYVKAKDTQNHEVHWPASDPNVLMFGTALTTTLNDTFETNLGWTVVNDPSLLTGAWVRADPNGTALNGAPANPENDSNDAGAQCMFTGQAAVGGGAGDQDVDEGPTRLLSPVFDLSGGNGVIDFQFWFFNDDGDDPLVIEISNNGGATWTTVRTVMFTGTQNAWTKGTILVGNVIAPTNNMRVRFSTSDVPNDSVTEAAVDAFRVRRLQ